LKSYKVYFSLLKFSKMGATKRMFEEIRELERSQEIGLWSYLDEYWASAPNPVPIRRIPKKSYELVVWDGIKYRQLAVGFFRKDAATRHAKKLKGQGYKEIIIRLMAA
jgi:hypothetical protein